MVLKRLWRAAADPAPAAYRVPDGERVYAIGDIHGRLDLLNRLIDTIDADDAARGPARTQLIFLGDLVDRGADSCGVVDRVKRLAADGRPVRVLMGNHEEVFLKAAKGDRAAMRFLARMGGESTVLSYGVSQADYDACDFGELADLFARRVPPDHVAFVESFENQVQVGDYVFVHAGIRPHVAMADQKGADLRWIRGDFLSYRGDHGVMVVHGHTVTDDVDEQPNRIGIDTGAFASGRLTAIGLEGEDRWYLAT
jgi:serine/threonine protein phosphatase 1